MIKPDSGERVSDMGLDDGFGQWYWYWYWVGHLDTSQDCWRSGKTDV
jgi:hypothetical protein